MYFTKCCVPQCNRFGIKMHNFPPDIENRLKWMEAIERMDLKDLDYESLKKTHRVCSGHFADEYKYKNKANRYCLTENAYPTLKLPEIAEKEVKEDDELVEFSSVCRACMSMDNELVDLSHKLMQNFNGFDFYSQYLFINAVEGDDLPQQICTTCMFELHRAYLFISNCRKADEQLHLITEGLEICDIPLLDDPFEEAIEDPLSIDPEPMEIFISDVDNQLVENNENCDEENDDGDDNNETLDEVLQKNATKRLNKKEIGNYTKLYESGPIKVDEPGPPFECINCRTQFDSLKALKQHRTKEKHYIVRQYKCRYCEPSKIFTFPCWKNHMRVHTGERPHKCPTCEKRFSASSSYKKHLNICTGQPKPRKVYNENELKHFCDKCGKGYPKRKDLATHLYKVHKHHEYNLKDGFFECKVCNEMFTTKVKFTKHMMDTCGVKYMCSICDKFYSYKTYLERHMKVHDDPEGKEMYKCEQCEKMFVTRGGLSQHKSVHVKKEFMCTECGKKLKSKETLKNHVLQHSSEEYPFKCEFCGNGYPTASGYKYHRERCDFKDFPELADLD